MPLFEPLDIFLLQNEHVFSSQANTQRPPENEGTTFQRIVFTISEGALEHVGLLFNSPINGNYTNTRVIQASVIAGDNSVPQFPYFASLLEQQIHSAMRAASVANSQTALVKFALSDYDQWTGLIGIRKDLQVRLDFYRDE